MTIARLIAGHSVDIISCPSTMSVGAAVKLLAERRIGALPVVDDGQVVGVFSERDIVYQLAAQGPALLDRPVSDAMSAPAVTVEPSTGVLDALGLMTRRRFRHLPVVKDGTMVGFVSIGDLVKYRIEHIVSEAEAMRSYIQSA